jgi:hypothetical protein
MYKRDLLLLIWAFLQQHWYSTLILACAGLKTRVMCKQQNKSHSHSFQEMLIGDGKYKKTLIDIAAGWREFSCFLVR